jgi:hypothetical protein
MNIGKLESTELIRTSRPPDESNFPFQQLNFFWNLSSTSLQSLLESFR